MNTILIIIIVIMLVMLSLKFERNYYNYTKELRMNIPYRERMDILNDFLMIVYTVAHTNNLHPIIYYGTLLGYIRENRIICYDFDLDFIISKEEYDIFFLKLKEYLEGHKRYEVKKMLNDVLKKKIQIIDRITNINCDIDMFKERKEYFTHSYNDFYTKKVLKECSTNHPLNKLYPLNTGLFNGVVIYFPNDPLYFLKCFYGDDYIKPTYICDDECNNCQSNSALKI